MYAIIYYKEDSNTPFPFVNGSITNNPADNNLVVYKTIEEADKAAFAIEDLSHDILSCVVISLEPANDNAQD